jgi:transmembrane protein 222
MKMTEKNEDLSFTILWSPLAPITWIFPFIGHTGIADSRGIASDFQGPYYVGDQGRMAFGPPTRALKINVSRDGTIMSCSSSSNSNDSSPGCGEERWDEAIQEANQVYRGRMHNICCDNCHSHVCNALNRMPIKAYNISKWNMVNLCFLMFFRARFLSTSAIFVQFGPFLVLVLIIVLTTSLT